MKPEISVKNLRVFGAIWALIFAYLAHKDFFSEISFSLSCLLLLIAILQPRLFLITRVYQGWIKFGNVAGKINGFLISLILFCTIFTPVSLILKILKKDLLKKKLDPETTTYFTDRESQPGDMKNQF